LAQTRCLPIKIPYLCPICTQLKIPAAQVLSHFHVDVASGLSDTQVLQNRALYGRNEMPPEEGTPFWKLVLKQFDDLLVKILLVAALISFLLALGDGDGGTTAFVEPFVSFSG
jgi:Ca2+ transporting ATPase